MATAKKPRAKRKGTRGPARGTGGRPKVGKEMKTLTRTRPWEKQGISQRTWYRRKAARIEARA